MVTRARFERATPSFGGLRLIRMEEPEIATEFITDGLTDSGQDGQSRTATRFPHGTDRLAAEFAAGKQFGRLARLHRKAMGEA